MPNPSNDDEAESRLRVGHRQVTTQARNQNASFQPTTTGKEKVDPDAENSALSCNKRRKIESKVQEDKQEDVRKWVIRKYSQHIIVYSSKSRNQLKRCQTMRNRDGSGDRSITCDLTAGVGAKEKYKMDHELKHLDLARKIIKQGITSLNSIKADILHVYKEEKEKLHRYFSNLSSKFSLTIDCLFRSSDDHMFCCLRVHFIDNNWELKNKVISFKYVSCPRFPAEEIKSLLSYWKIDSRTIAVQVHAIEDGKIKCSLEHPGIFSHFDVLDIYSLVHVLDDTYREGAELAFDTFEKIRKMFDYIHETSSNEQKFQIAVDKAKSLGKKVPCQGLPTSSISDLELIKSAVGFVEAFTELQKIDLHFFSLNLKRDWDIVKALYQCWELSNYIACFVHESRYLTANEYFPKVCDIRNKLEQFHQRCFWNPLSWKVKSIKEDFEEVWNNHIKVLEIAVILDPRFKLNIIKCWYKKIYGEFADSCIMNTRVTFYEVFHGYEQNYKKNLKMLDQLGRPQTSSQDFNVDNKNCELSRYLKEAKFPLVEDFNILAWWRANSPKFPILARIARDFLPVSYSAAVSDSGLWTEIEDVVGSKCLDFGIREALVCTRNWLHSP